MSDSGRNNNNPFDFLSQFFGALNHPFIVDNYSPFLTNLLLIVSFSGFGGLAITVPKLIGLERKIQTEEDNPPLPTNDKYEEHIIDIKSACRTKFMKDRGRKELGIPQGFNITITRELSNTKEIWPVYRWRCFYRSGTKISPPIGLDLKGYCQQQYGEIYSFGYKNYLDPYSLVCTSVWNEAMFVNQVPLLNP